MDPAVLSKLAAQYETAVTAEDVFHYIFGVLNAPGYQVGFETLLQEDFPRIPFTTDFDSFAEMAKHGKRLVELLLLEANDLQGVGNIIVGFPVVGGNRVEKDYPTFDPSSGRVAINPTQHSMVSPKPCGTTGLEVTDR